VAAVVDPRHAEHDRAVRLDDALEYAVLVIDGIFVDQRRERFEHFPRGLMEFRFPRVSLDDMLKDVVCVGHSLFLPRICKMVILYTANPRKYIVFSAFF